MIDLYHGSHNGTTAAHEGQCWTDYARAAAIYAGEGTMVRAAIDLGEFTVEECEGYDRHDHEAPADGHGYSAAAATCGADILRYDDEDEHGQALDCYRLVSARAVAAFAALVIECERDEDEDWITN